MFIFDGPQHAAVHSICEKEPTDMLCTRPGKTIAYLDPITVSVTIVSI